MSRNNTRDIRRLSSVCSAMIQNNLPTFIILIHTHDTRWHYHAKYVLPNMFSVSFYKSSLSCVTNFMRSSKRILTQLVKVNLAATGLDDPCTHTRFFSFTKIWGPPSHLFNGYQGLFPHGHETHHSTHSKLQGQESVELNLCSPYTFMVCTGTTLPLPWQ